MFASNSLLRVREADSVDTISPLVPASATRRRDWQSIALMSGGVLFAVGNLLHPLQHDDAAYHSTTWQAAHLTIFASLPLLVLGLPALYACLAPRVGHRLTSCSIVASIVGLIGIGPGAIVEAFVAPMIGHEAMEQLESGGMAAVDAIFGLAFLGGSLALGWALYRSRLRPRWAGPSIFVGTLALLTVMNATGPAAGVVIIAATTLYGLALAALARAQIWSRPRPRTSRPSRAGRDFNATTFR